MEKTLKILNQLEKEGIINRYAIGGGVASLFYAEPMLTYDMDVFVFLSAKESGLALLSSLHDPLRKLGYREDKEHVVIEGVPVQFIPAYNALVEEAVRRAKQVPYKDVKTKVLCPEHLAALMLQTGRPKDKMRLTLFLQQAKMNRQAFTKIINRHGLKEKWIQFQRGSS